MTCSPGTGRRQTPQHDAMCQEWTVTQRSPGEVFGTHTGQSAAAEIVKEVAAQESKHATAKARSLLVHDLGDDPWCRTKQAALSNDLGDQWVPVDQRLLCVFRHVPGDDLWGRREHFRHCTGNVRVAQNVRLR